MVCRDIYGEHPYDLPARKVRRCRDWIALAKQEAEELRERQ